LVFSGYGIIRTEVVETLSLFSPQKSPRAEALEASTELRLPIRMDPGFDPRKTSNLGRMVEQWGLVPLAYLAQFANTSFTYGYIGTDDLSMYPLLPPGSFVQIDESKNKVVQGLWRTEYERPIYFVET